MRPHHQRQMLHATLSYVSLSAMNSVAKTTGKVAGGHLTAVIGSIMAQRQSLLAQLQSPLDSSLLASRRFW